MSQLGNTESCFHPQRVIHVISEKSNEKIKAVHFKRDLTEFCTRKVLFSVGKTGNDTLQRNGYCSKPCSEYQLRAIDGVYTKINGNGRQKI